MDRCDQETKNMSKVKHRNMGEKIKYKASAALVVINKLN